MQFPVSPYRRAVIRQTVFGGCLIALCASCQAAGPPAAHEVIVPATDYAFQVAKELPVGPVSFRLDNRGKVAHEMALGQLKAGVSVDSVMSYVSHGGDPGNLSDGVVGILIAEAGKMSLGTVQAELVAGHTYMMICQFKDTDSSPPHIAMGMTASFVAK
ncbi:MAG: hypothetical protein ABJB74_01960 [Gemmatimonas sp.]